MRCPCKNFAPTAMNKTHQYTIQSLYCSRFLPTLRFARNDGRIAKKGVAAEAAAAVRVSSLRSEQAAAAASAAVLFATTMLSFRMKQSGMRNLERFIF